MQTPRKDVTSNEDVDESQRRSTSAIARHSRRGKKLRKEGKTSTFSRRDANPAMLQHEFKQKKHRNTSLNAGSHLETSGYQQTGLTLG